MSDEDMELVMPFVCVASRGGPFDDDAFAAGWDCAAIDALLAQQPAEVEQTVRASLVAQLDLIAMRHGYVMSTESSEDPEWVFASWAAGGADGSEQP